MKSMRFSLPLLATLAITFSPAVRAQAQTFRNLASFDGADGEQPYSGSLVQGTNGNYYGTAFSGGRYGAGVVFEVSAEGNLRDVYDFCPSICPGGGYPFSGLVLGSDGDFYGDTSTGSHYGAGAIFKVTTASKLTILYNFCPGYNCVEGSLANALVLGSDGNFYGTTSYGGANSGSGFGGGTVFKISPSSKFKSLYSFCSESDCADGEAPGSSPVQASNGNFYGTTGLGGIHSAGTVYEITTAGQFRTLYRFCALSGCADGSNPWGGLIQGSDGDLYGTAFNGGAYGQGTVFKITTAGQLITLHSFDSNDGANPNSALVEGSDGNFYGAASEGGTGASGTVYEVTSDGAFSLLHTFCASGCGFLPFYSLTQATNGTFYGATEGGGSYPGYGTVFSLSMGLGPLVETVPTAAKAGANVIILGNGLTGSTSVTFNGAPAAFTVVSGTEITATVPTGATTGTVAVTTPTGKLNSNPVFQVLK